jgi:hypothetical protein
MAASKSAVTDTPGLVAFLYRADWTQLCAAATFSARAEDPRVIRIPGKDGWQPAGQAAETGERDPKETWRLATEVPEPPDVYEEDDEDEDEDEDYADDVPPHWRDSLSRVLIAPGERYRIEDARPDPDRGMILVRDSESLWGVSPDEAVRVPDLGLTAALMDLLDPSWLVSYFDLELAGTAEAAGRPAYRVTAAPRPVTTSTRDEHYERCDRVDVLVDAELGILLRREVFCGGQLIEATGLRSLALDPAEAGDPGQFRPPPGLPRTDPYADADTLFGTSGPGWRVVKTGAKAAAVALAYRIRQASRAQPAPAETSPPVPQPADRPAAGEAAGVSDDLVNLLHRTGLPPQRFAAGMRKWSDSELMLRSVAAYRAAQPPGLRGVLGPDAVWDALTEAPQQTSFQTARLRVALPGKYRIDYLDGDWHSSVAACDGTRQWTVYPNRVVTEPARPLSEDWADLVDPGWLLASGWRLSAAGARDVGGRRGWRIWADTADGNDLRETRGTQMFPRAAVVIDAELGIVLQLAFLVDDRPAVCFELHDVTVPPADDVAGFSVEIPPGTRVVEASSVFDYLDIPRPVKAAWTAGKAGLAGASAVAGWLKGTHGEGADQEPGS